MTSHNHEIPDNPIDLESQVASLQDKQIKHENTISLDDNYNYFCDINLDGTVENGVIYEEAAHSMMMKSVETSPNTSRGAIASVTNHFRISPSPISRRISPNPSSTSSTSGSLHASNTSSEAQLRIQAAEIRNNNPFGHESVFAYLGEELSVHNRDPFISGSPCSSEYDEASYMYLRHNMRLSRPYMRRAVSLEWLSQNSKDNNTRPCMSQLPVFNPDHDIVDMLNTITVDDWVMPYIITLLKKPVLEFISLLPKLFDIKEYTREPSDDPTSRGYSEDSDVHNAIQNSIDDVHRNRSTSYTIRDHTSSSSSSTGLRQRSISDAHIFENSSKSLNYHHRPVPIRPHELLSPNHHHTSSYTSSSPYCPRANSTSPSSIADSSLTCRCLGLLYCNRDPSWTPWDMRFVYLVDNYLYEVTNDNQDIIGYCPLSGATITREICPGYRDTLGLCIKCLTSCTTKNMDMTSLRTLKFWLRPILDDDIDTLEEVMRRACMLTIEDIYILAHDDDDGDDDENLLGRGRFNEVRKARRRVPHPNFINSSSSSSYNATKIMASNSLPSYPRSISPSSEPSYHDHPSKSGGIAMLPKVISSSSLSYATSSPYDGLPPSPPKHQHKMMGSPYINNDTQQVSNTSSSSSLSSCIALKIISKEIFHDRVLGGKERADSLVREVVAQALVYLYIASLSNRMKAIDSKLPSSASPPPSSAAASYPSSSLSSSSSSIIQDDHTDTSTPTYTTITPSSPSSPIINPSHIPIVQLLGVFETIDGFAMELELMQQLDMYEVLLQEEIFSEDAVKHIVKQLVTACMYCLKAGVTHRDIKLSNITLPTSSSSTTHPSSTSLPTSPIRIKLADFGMAGFISHDKKVRGRCGTPGYVAPDILRAGVNESYHTNIDMFSIGVVAYVLLCGYEPFYGSDDHQVIQSNRNVEYAFHDPEWSRVSDEAKDWISLALHPYAETRLRPDDALKHAWLCPLPSVSHHQSIAGTGAGARGANPVPNGKDNKSNSASYNNNSMREKHMYNNSSNNNHPTCVIT